MSESKACGTCGRYIDVPVFDGGPDDRIGVCPCAWRVSFTEMAALFEGLHPGDEPCENYKPRLGPTEQNGVGTE